LLGEARLALLGGRIDAAEAALDAAERAWEAPGNADEERYEPAASPGASLLGNVPATIALDRAYLAELRGDVERAMTYASQAKAWLNAGEWMLRSHADAYLAVAALLDGRPDEAEHVLTSVIAVWRDAGERYLAVRGCHHLGQVQRAQGRLQAAVDTYREALDLAAATPAAGIAHVGLAELAYQRNDLERAHAHLDDGIPSCRQLVYTQPLATGLATLAWVRQAEGDAAAALDAMAEADRVARDLGVTNVLNPVPVQRARLWLIQGDVDAASRWLEQRRVGVDDEPTYASEPDHLLLAQMLVAQERPRDALGLLERLIAPASARRRTGSLIELHAVRAAALLAAGDDAAALRTLVGTLRDACPRGYVRVFADAGTPLRTLLGRLVKARSSAGDVAGEVPFDCLVRLQHAFAVPASPRGDPDPRSWPASSTRSPPASVRCWDGW
jgi:LuxR family maltose regulon positive regulatory protein